MISQWGRFKRQLMNNIHKARKKGEDLDHLHYRALLSQSFDGIFVFDPKTRQIKESNRQLLDLLGYNQAEILKLKVNNLIYGDVHIYKNKFLQALQGKVIHTPLNFRCKDGSKVETEVRASLLDLKINKACIVNVKYWLSGNEFTKDQNMSRDYVNRVLEETLNAFIKISEKNDLYTHIHQERVARLASSIAKEMNLSDSQVESVVIASKLHDLGKINIPVDILVKPGALSKPEIEIIKSHPKVAYEILAKVPFNYPIADIVAQHHERWNGTGYPNQLAGENILLEARILAVADVVEAIASHRPYRPALGIEKALEEIEINSAILYDPQIVEACSAVLRKNNMDEEKIF